MACQTPNQFYKDIKQQIEGLISSEPDLIANLANVSSVISFDLNEKKSGTINWCGFYLKRGDQLVLGPFQGRVACIRINFGKGVCGTAAQTKISQVIPDVHKFPGHIACDSASNSEIVVPIIVNGETIGVLDIDSNVHNTFDEEDRVGLEDIVTLLSSKLKWEQLQDTGKGVCHH